MCCWRNSPTSASPRRMSLARFRSFSLPKRPHRSLERRSRSMAAGPHIDARHESKPGGAIMTTTKGLTPLEAVNEIRSDNKGQVVLVLQGGGALGAYQGGVYQALHEAGVEPDWVIGTSIGAINASIITGNKIEDRLPRLQEFWKRVERSTFWGAFPALAGVA